MSLKRILAILKKDFSVGPRKPFFIWALVMPFALTLLFQFAFGSLFEPKPRLALVDYGTSSLTDAIVDLDGFSVEILNSREDLLQRVEKNDFDAGAVLSADFDGEVKAGEKPLLEIYISGESFAVNRIVIAITALEMIRGLEGEEAPVKIVTEYFGEPGLPFSVRLVPVVVFYALVMAGVWVPSASIVEEKENKTLTAMLVSPSTATEVLAAKWLLGFLFAIFLAIATLLLNQAFSERPADVIAVVVMAAALTRAIGLLIGIFAKTATALFTIVKSLGIFLFVPVVFYLFPDWPQWIAKLFPLYWIIEPIWTVSVMGEPISAVQTELIVAGCITVALGLAVILFKDQLLRQ